MSQTPQPEKKSRFQLSREVQEEYVNGIADTMLKLAERAGGKKTIAAPLEVPFSTMTDREFGGANMTRLMLASMEKGYKDNRWITYNQLEQLKKDNPDLKTGFKKGQHGIKLLRPEEIFFTVKEDGKWNFLTQDEARDIEAQRKQGADLPPTQHKTLFYPFTVFNAEQLYGFPPKEQPAQAMTAAERNEFVDRLIASSGVAVEHHSGPASYDPATDQIKMPFPDSFDKPEEYYAVKLREFYSATGHSSRENRQREPQTLKSRAFEEMRAEMFSIMAGAKLNLPMPENSAASQMAQWNQKFSGGDVKEVFRAATDAARMVSTMRQYEAGERPKAWWFPKEEAWPELQAMQKERDAAVGAYVQATDKAAQREPASRSGPPSLVESVAAFQATDDPVAKARLILQNPEFLNMALQQDPNAARELASLCDSLSTVLHMELDEQARQGAAPAAPAPEQQTASAPRMRM